MIQEARKKELEYQIAKLLYYCTKNGKMIDKKLTLEFLKNIVYYNNLGGYLRKVDFDLKNKNCYAAYYYHLKTLSINPMFYENIKNKKNISLLKRNVLIIQVLLHEMEHVFQYEKITLKKDSLEAKLLNASFDFTGRIITLDDKKELYLSEQLKSRFFIRFKRQFYHELYPYIPSERIANANSWAILEDALRKFDLEASDKAIITCKKNWFYDLDSGYDKECVSKSNFPLKKFALVHDNVPILKPVNVSDLIEEWENILSIEEKFTYGFPITDLEYRKIKKEKLKNKNYVLKGV